MGVARQTLWETGHDESVEVNQRALIDKVLARYSGEFTVFRELLQNSDDARSTAVEIRFETERFSDRKADKSTTQEASTVSTDTTLPDLKTAVVHQWSFKNNGIAFRNEDWNRLKKIAEGNPDEEKIGAFGVGFYSLFSVTEEPFVTSGDQWMGFYWKDGKDQLFARRGQLPSRTSQETDSWTIFDMALREPAPIPVAFDFTRFLASSITFMTHLLEISVYYDDKCLTRLTKRPGIPKELGIPKGLNNASRLGMMTVNNIKSTPLHIRAEVMRWIYTSGTEKPRQPPIMKSVKPGGQGGFFSSLFSSLAGGTTPQRAMTPISVVPSEVTDPQTIHETNVALSIFSADVDVRLDRKVAAELHRSTKKNPPARMKYELIYTAKSEYDASQEEDKLQPFITGSIFQGLRADLDGAGSARIFIGHATAQTTGLGGHMAARFIPTVERESIDFMDRNVATWNKELLYVGGFLARSAYEFELRAIDDLWKTSVVQDVPPSEPSQDVQRMLRSRSSHALKFFTFHQSTPSAEVSNQLESAFFSCSPPNQFFLMSTRGVRNCADIRLPDPAFAGFLKQLPLLTDEVLTGAPAMVASLQSRGLVKEIAFEDVLKELRSRPLGEEEVISCLKWWIALCKQGNSARLAPIRAELLDAAVLTTGTGERIIPLNSLKTFINPKAPIGSIPLDGPLPDHLLPLSISKAFSSDLISSTLPWTELTITEWLEHVCSPAVGRGHVEFDINSSAPWAERVLSFLARVWPTMSATMKNAAISVVRDKTCIPTSNGMKIPDEAYFVSANIFNDLPVVLLPSGAAVKGPLERVLQALGVRKHVDLQIVFNRMIKTNEWTIADLTKYLVSVKTTLTAEELQRLKITAAFPKEKDSTKPVDSKPVRYRAAQLYEPQEVFRQLSLPVIDWGKQTKWRASSEEAKFLFELGLQRYPSLDALIGLSASADDTIRAVALKYLIEHLGIRYQDYEPSHFENVAYIPALKGTQECMATPKEVFSNPEWMALGFLVIHPSVQVHAEKLKVKEHPLASQLVQVLRTTQPKDSSEARKWFTMLSRRVHDFSVTDLSSLSTTPLVPVITNQIADSAIRWLPPSQCYLGGNAKDKFHSRLFVFVDFGSAGNAFLTACGAKHEPSVEEVAKILLTDPHKFYELAQGPTHFLAELRNIAVNSRLISSGTTDRMKNSPILLGHRRQARQTDKKLNVEEIFDDEEWDFTYDLKRPDQIVIADDTHAYQAFGDSLFTAPQEDILEAFYIQLGSRRLSSLVKEEYHTTAEISNSKIATETRTLILQRLPLFLHEHTHAPTQVTFAWLSSERNFVVKTFGKLSVTKSLTFGEHRLSQKQDSSAVAKRFGYGPIQLWLSGNTQVDMYEVATSLNRLLFKAPKANDALLFMTILSTDLRSLKRRGYNVDRILKQQMAEKKAAEDVKHKEENTTLISRPVSKTSGTSSTSGLPTHMSNPLPEPAAVPSGLTNPTATSSVMNSLHNFRRRMETSLNPREKGDVISSPVQEKPQPPSLPSKSNAILSRPSSSGAAVTPLSNISSNISMAIRACRPESGNLLRNRQEMQQVKESLDEGYCDISGRVGNLNVAGEMGKVKIYLSQEVPQLQAQTFMQTKHDSLTRFIHVMTSLAGIYELPLTSLHIFFDLDGGLIAFNRNGSVFLNLRYFEAWHDADVRSGKLDSAYVSWYFTLAHEIAHNLVQPHNSEHEFYFSAICERYLMALGRILTLDRLIEG